MNATERELAWAAGFFDGEGTFNGWIRVVRRRTYYCPSVHITQVHREPLDRFKLAVGEGTVMGPYQARRTEIRPNRRPVYVYSVNKQLSVKRVYRLLEPYLCSIKVAQGLKVINGIDMHAYRIATGNNIDTLKSSLPNSGQS